MRSSALLVVAVLLLGATSADLARRLGAFDALKALGRGTAADARTFDWGFELEDYDGATSTLKLLVRPESGSKIESVTLHTLTLGGHPPLESLPLSEGADAAGVVALRVRIRDVAWELAGEQASWESSAGASRPGTAREPVFQARIVATVAVLLVGSDRGVPRYGSASLPITVTGGRGHAGLVRRFGGGK